jgi:hypothetical protein
MGRVGRPPILKWNLFSPPAPSVLDGQVRACYATTTLNARYFKEIKQAKSSIHRVSGVWNNMVNIKSPLDVYDHL